MRLHNTNTYFTSRAAQEILNINGKIFKYHLEKAKQFSFYESRTLITLHPKRRESLRQTHYNLETIVFIAHQVPEKAKDFLERYYKDAHINAIRGHRLIRISNKSHLNYY